MSTLKIFLRAVLLKYGQEMRRMRSLVTGLFFAAVPLAFLLVIMRWADVENATDFSLGYYLFLYGGVSTLFFAMIMGIGLYQREIEGGTIPYMLEIPLKRYQIHISRYLSTILYQYTFLIPSLLISYLLIVERWGDVASEGGGLPLLIIMMLGGIMAYTAIFSVLSFTVPKPLLVSFIYSVFWEYLLGISTLRMKKLTVMFYLKSLVIRAFMKSEAYAGGGEKLASVSDCLYALVLTSVAAAALGAILLSIKNFEKS